MIRGYNFKTKRRGLAMQPLIIYLVFLSLDFCLVLTASLKNVEPTCRHMILIDVTGEVGILSIESGYGCSVTYGKLSTTI